MSWTFSREWLASPSAGIPVNTDGDPLEPTIVFCSSETEFQKFCEACKVNPESPNVLMLLAHDISPWEDMRMQEDYCPYLKSLPWKQVAFIGIDPMGFYLSGNYRCAWPDLDQMRKNRQLTRAFRYGTPPANICPDVRSEERNWD